LNGGKNFSLDGNQPNPRTSSNFPRVFQVSSVRGDRDGDDEIDGSEPVTCFKVVSKRRTGP
jgi:hypothetical protein